MRTRTAVIALLAGALAVLAVGSYATADSGKKHVDAGDDERLPGGSAGRSCLEHGYGSFEATINTGNIEYTLTYSGLEGNVDTGPHPLRKPERQRRDLGVAVRHDGHVRRASGDADLRRSQSRHDHGLDRAGGRRRPGRTGHRSR